MAKDTYDKPHSPADLATSSDELLRLGHTSWLDANLRTAGGTLAGTRKKGDADDAFEELTKILEIHMDAGRDDIIAHALTEAHRTGAEDVANEIETACEIASTSLLAQPADGSTPGRRAFLFAFPICVYASKPLPERLGPDRLISAIEDSINGFSLFSDNPDINLSDRLITLEQMEMLSYSALRQITRELADGGKLLIPECDTENSDSKTDAENGSTPEQRGTQLRYMLFSITQDDVEPAESDIESAGEDDGREEAWIEYVHGLIEPRIALDPEHGFLSLGYIDDFFEAQNTGQIEQANVALMAYLRDFVQQLPRNDSRYGAVVAPFGEDNLASEIRIALVDFTNLELAGAFRYPLIRPEDVDVALDKCGRIAREFGFNPVKIYAELQTDSDELAPGEAGFLMHHPTASVLPAVPFPTSTLIH